LAETTVRRTSVLVPTTQLLLTPTSARTYIAAQPISAPPAISHVDI
jgi:hypothetical protein